MADDQERGGPSPEDLGQDPFVERLRPDAAQPPERVRILEGLLGDSGREGYKRLYFTRELDHYAEFRAEDVLFREPIPSEQAPLVGLEASRVGVRRDATIEYTRDRTPRPVDEFDLDIRLAAATRQRARLVGTKGCCTNDPGTCPSTDQTDCFPCGTGQTDCFPCGTGQTDCFPCGTGQTDCFHCPTGQTDCFHCPAARPINTGQTFACKQCGVVTGLWC